MCWQRIYSNSSLWGEISMVNLGYSRHSSIFTLLKHLMMLLKYNFSGLHFYTLPKTLIPFTTIQFRFFFEKWKHAFNLLHLPSIKSLCECQNILHPLNSNLIIYSMTGSFKEEIGTEYCRDFENARNRSIKRVSFSENIFLTPYYMYMYLQTPIHDFPLIVTVDKIMIVIF